MGEREGDRGDRLPGVTRVRQVVVVVLDVDVVVDGGTLPCTTSCFWIFWPLSPFAVSTYVCGPGHGNGTWALPVGG